MKLTTIMDMAIVSSLLAAPACESPLVRLHDFDGHLSDAVGVLALINNGGVVRSGYLDYDEGQGPSAEASGVLFGTYLTGSEFSVSGVSGYMVLSHLGNYGRDAGQYGYDGQRGSSSSTSHIDTGTLTVNAALSQQNTKGGSNHRAYLNRVLMESVSDSADSGNYAPMEMGGFGARPLARLFRDGSETRNASQASGGDPYLLQRWNAVFAKSSLTGVTAVPEPSTYLAGLGAFVMLGLFAWRSRK